MFVANLLSRTEEDPSQVKPREENVPLGERRFRKTSRMEIPFEKNPA